MCLYHSCNVVFKQEHIQSEEEELHNDEVDEMIWASREPAQTNWNEECAEIKESTESNVSKSITHGRSFFPPKCITAKLKIKCSRVAIFFFLGKKVIGGVGDDYCTGGYCVLLEMKRWGPKFPKLSLVKHNISRLGNEISKIIGSLYSYIRTFTQ